MNPIESLIGKKVNYPIPEAFGEKDVDINAEELYADSFQLTYTRLMNEYVLQHYCQAYSLATRTDIRDFFSECINTSRDIHQRASDVLLAKGLLQIEVLGDILEGEDLPTPKTFDYEVTTSKQSPFSDRLILFHYTVVLAYTILGYGFALTNSARKDVIATFSRLIAELLGFAKDGTDIMIEHNWLERPPETADRKLIQ
ncbi:DUF3231 family protein [Desulfitobacterium sp.]|uniref:DUF3231 family protein n=1 Tax=Desulfitobacterium sp. TaxID=49981 RepID=UPI002C143F45|nr:DUF3231 family protein [Desulfitobacterium sp.]HVJ49088.1 DUF3231 family protein [Desulfitobacterium sp.]